MKMKRLAALACSLALSVPVWADVLVPAGESLVVTNTEALGFGNLQLGAGSTLVFGGSAVGSAGLNEYTRTNTFFLGAPNGNTYGNWTRITTNAFWASTTITNASTEYIYTGRWYVPNAGLYSFFEFVDDMDSITIDGVVVLQSGNWTDATCARNVSLSAGWHDLELRAFNGASTGGMVSNTLASGFLYSPNNDLISVTNVANAFPFVDAGNGAALLSVHNGTLVPKLYVSGETTFDLTQQNLAAPLNLLGGLFPTVSTNAKVTVAGGTGEILFGTPNQGVHFTPFNADIAFTGVENPAGVTFRDYSTVIAWPASCPWRIANNATVALYGTNMLGAGDVTLTNYNVYVLSPYAVAAGATIHVQGTNRTAYVKPCTIDTNGNWSGANVVVTNNLSLEGVNSTANFPINVDLVLQGSISGTGTVTKTGSARAEIKGGSTFVGPVSVVDNGTLIFDSATAGDSNNTVTVSAGATFSLYPSGYGTADTTAWIKTLTGGGTSGKIFLPAKQTLTIDTFNGALSVQGSGSALQVNALGTNAVLVVSGQTAVTLVSAAPGATLTLGAGTTLSVPSSGITLDALTLSSGPIPVSGKLTVALLGGTGKLIKQGADTLTVYFSTNTTGVQVDAGKLTLSSDTNAVLGSLPALWLDASASGVFTQYKSYAFTNGFINIERWNDCRPDAPYYGYNGRGNDNRQVYPYLMTNNQNGMPAVSMGSHLLTLTDPYIGPDGNGVEARRLPLSTNIYPQYAVMVFGSQNGGGAAVLGGSAALNRAGSTINDFRNPATPILATAGYPVWTNGVSVVATNTGFTGGYQILTVNTKGQLVNALGWRLDNTTAGGQNYAEVLLYTNALTAGQRLTAEAYLAKKWNLPFAYPACELSNATVAAGATLEVGSTFSIARLNGAGTVIAASGASLQPAGYFTGSLTLNSGAFSVTNLPVPPKASVVPTAALSCWFDPSVTSRVVFGSAYTPSRPLAVAALYDRTTSNRYLFGSCNVAMAVDRRPWLSATNGPMGETQYWLDYSNRYGDGNGNTLRLYRNPAYIGTDTTGYHTPTNVQTAFIVLDSSRGGGVPITYDVAASQVFTRDNPLSSASPIWGASTAGAVKYGQTFLDGVSVNGATRGYSGTTELLSLVATNAVQAAFFGFYGASNESATWNRERLGEIILFDSALSDATRADVEAYLMAKWLGRARAGYSDFTAATVTGSGTVTAAKIQQLPALGAGFTGDVTLTDTAFAFTFSTNAGQYVVAPALTAPAALTVPATGSVSVNFLARPASGTYTLLNYGTATGTGFSNWSLTTSGSVPSGPVRLQTTATALTIVVIPQGTLLRVL